MLEKIYRKVLVSNGRTHKHTTAKPAAIDHSLSVRRALPFVTAFRSHCVSYRVSPISPPFIPFSCPQLLTIYRLQKCERMACYMNG